MNYRKIYAAHYGPIPKDPNGRTYQIHHIDGNHANDSPDNLQSLSIQAHFDIHLDQGDYGACLRIGAQMKISPEEKSQLASLVARKQVVDGKHSFMRRPDGSSIQTDKVKEGKHHLLKRADGTSLTSDRTKAGTNPWQVRADGTSLTSDRTKAGTNPWQVRADGTSHNMDKVKSGKHHLLKRIDGTSVTSDRVKNGTHPSQKQWKCEHCNTEGKHSGCYARWHGDNCKAINRV